MAFAVNCPECGTALEVEEAHREWTVRCPNCRHEFRPSEATFALAPTEDRDEHDPPPRKRRRSRRREVDVEAAERDVATPALVLEVIGWVSLLLVGGLSAFLVIAGVAQQGQPQQPNQDPPEMLIFLGTCLGVFSAPYFAVIGFGARKMRNLSSHGWGMAAAIMAIAAIVLFGLCGLPIIAPGIWALVVLLREDVKAAFARRRGDDQDYDD
jgi:hypothetical protein